MDSSIIIWTTEHIEALNAAKGDDSIRTFAKKVNIPDNTLGRMLNGKTEFVKQPTWLKVLPYMEPHFKEEKHSIDAMDLFSPEEKDALLSGLSPEDQEMTELLKLYPTLPEEDKKSLSGMLKNLTSVFKRLK